MRTVWNKFNSWALSQNHDRFCFRQTQYAIQLAAGRSTVFARVVDQKKKKARRHLTAWNRAQTVGRHESIFSRAWRACKARGNPRKPRRVFRDWNVFGRRVLMISSHVQMDASRVRGLNANTYPTRLAHKKNLCFLRVNRYRKVRMRTNGRACNDISRHLPVLPRTCTTTLCHVGIENRPDYRLPELRTYYGI